jgi:hypothetical protein
MNTVGYAYSLRTEIKPSVPSSIVAFLHDNQLGFPRNNTAVPEKVGIPYKAVTLDSELR